LGIYSEYLDKQMDFAALTAERKAQLKRISELRGGRDILVFAANLNAFKAPISINFSDLLPINDQLSNLKGTKLDVLLETPGGSGETVEDIVRILRGKYSEVSMIIPGWAKSAGAIMAMSGDEILMEPASALGPIDAQMTWQGKVFSADALLEGVEKIKKEVESSGILNKAYIPILQGLSPGELQEAENALNFAQELVTSWLATYKFKNWNVHASTGKPVTEEEKTARANEIAGILCDHQRWRTHARSIKLDDLQNMRLQVTDYCKQPDLADAIRRYYVLLQMTFVTNIYKVIETPQSQIYRALGAAVPSPQQMAKADKAEVDVQCGKCKTPMKVQANLGKAQPLTPGCLPFPADNKLRCPKCGAETDVTAARLQLEAMAKKPIM
jgi:hypothetical protein